MDLEALAALEDMLVDLATLGDLATLADVLTGPDA